MSSRQLDFAEPFFSVIYLEEEDEYRVVDRSILLNLSEAPIRIQDQQLGLFQSAVILNSLITGIERAVFVERFAGHADESALFDEVKSTWPLAYDIRQEERLKGVSHYMSPKASVGNIQFSMYHTASVPLNVGLHKTHAGGPDLKEVHTQIVGFGKMQQCLENDMNTLYLEEPMAPGATHRPMFDGDGNYPWHQYETITPGIIMAIEML